MLTTTAGEYKIEVDNCKNIKGLIVKEDLVKDACEWAAEVDDYYYQMKDSLLSYDEEQIDRAKKSYTSHINKILKFINLGAKIITD